MADQRDFLDELIDLKEEWQSVKNLPQTMVGSLLPEEGEKKEYRPSNYKERPVALARRCMCVAVDRRDVCGRCVEVCPADAIKLSRNTLKIEDSCIKCGLCAAVCPAEAINASSHRPALLYDKIARAATAYTECYVTCTRALGRIPRANEIVLGCVGEVSRELWFSLLADYTNISVYLPLGKCDRCRTTTGEEVLSDAIAAAEIWADAGLGLETEADALVCEYTRNYKRSQFVSSALSSADRLLTRTAPPLAGAKAVAKKLNDHTKQLSDIQKQVEEAAGIKTSDLRRRALTANLKLMMGALQHDAGLADFIDLKHPVCDVDLCTRCGECVKVCTIHALDLDKNGFVTLAAPYCTGCEACTVMCEEAALSMERCDVSELIIPDKYAEEIRAKKAQAKAASKKYLEEAKRGLTRAADALGKLDDKGGEA